MCICLPCILLLYMENPKRSTGFRNICGISRNFLRFDKIPDGLTAPGLCIFTRKKMGKVPVCYPQVLTMNYVQGAIKNGIFGGLIYILSGFWLCCVALVIVGLRTPLRGGGERQGTLLPDPVRLSKIFGILEVILPAAPPPCPQRARTAPHLAFFEGKCYNDKKQEGRDRYETKSDAHGRADSRGGADRPRHRAR